MHSITIDRGTEAPREPTTELVKRCQRGDADAFEALYRLHVEGVYALCSRMSGDPTRAMELTQDVFVKAWRGLANFRGESSLATWLHRIAFNVVREDQRGNARRWLRQVDDLDLEKENVGAAGGLAEDERIDLERAIASLPARARNALILHDIHGYRCREVAELTGTAVGTIQAHLHRARRLLREVLEK